jgi:transposase InsO family protein
MLEGPHRIGWALGEARSTVYRVLCRHGMPRLGDLDRATRQVVRYQRQRPGELVHVDINKLGRVPDGGGWWAHGRQQRPNRHRGQGYDFLHVAVDDRSRVASAEPHPDERQATAAGFIHRAVRWFADHHITVERILTDNGNCYRSQAFGQALAELGVSHRHPRPYRPQTNGKVERFNLTLKLEWAYATIYASNQARLAHLEGWLHHYNHHRPHTAHQGAAPMTAVNNLPAKHT